MQNASCFDHLVRPSEESLEVGDHKPEPEPEEYVMTHSKGKNPNAKQPIPHLHMAERQYDFFVNHCQATGQDQCRTLATELKSRKHNSNPHQNLTPRAL